MDMTDDKKEVIIPFILRFVEPRSTGGYPGTTTNSWDEPADAADSD